MKKISLLLLAIAAASLMSFTGDKNEAVDNNTIAKIKEEGFNDSKVMETLFQLTDVNGPRLTGSTGMKSAEQWSSKQLKDWGLSNVAVEPWGTFGKGWANKKCYVAMSAPYYQQLIAVPKAWTPGTNGLLKGEAILALIENEKDFEKYHGQLKGKIVINPAATLDMKMNFAPDAKRLADSDLIKIYKDPRLDEIPTKAKPAANPTAARANALKWRSRLDSFLIAEQAVAVISSRKGTMGTVFTGNGASYAMDATAVLPELEMNGEHISRIVRLLQHNVPVTLEMDIQNTWDTKDAQEYNVVAEIPGTDKKLKDEVVIMGAHLDSWHGATGATDNGAGSAVMMEAIRILKAINAKPRRTIRVILWSGEEQGLLGSRGYVKNHYGDKATMVLKPEQAKVSAYFNLDNGGGKIRGIYAQNNDVVVPVFQAWMAPFQDLDATTVTIRNTGSTDHISFDEIGIPGFQFIQDPMEYGTRSHHTNMDTYERVVPNDLMQASVIVASFVYNTAMRDEKIPRKPLPTK